MTRPVTNRVAGIILAAGRSRRLGTPKQLLQINSQPVLQHVINTLNRSSVDERYIVIGHQADQIRQRVSLDKVSIIENPDYASGQSTSVQAAVTAVRDRVNAIIVLLGDQPAVSLSVINAVLASFRSHGDGIHQPWYKEGRGNPVLIGREFFAELLELEGDEGARPLIQRHRDSLHFVDVSNYERPRDIDTWDDYNAVRRTMESPVRPPGPKT